MEVTFKCRLLGLSLLLALADFCLHVAGRASVTAISTCPNTEISVKERHIFLFKCHCQRNAFASKYFSPLLKLHRKKRNSNKDVDSLMRGTIETRLKLRFSQLPDDFQQQPSH